jgi:hypothetical protein
VTVTLDVLLVVEARIASVQLIEQVLGRLNSQHGVTWRTRLDREVTGADFGAETVICVVRTSTPAASLFVDELRAHGVPYVFYIDDNFWLLDPRTAIGRHYAQRSTREALESIVHHAAAVIVSTTALAEQLGPKTKRVVHLDAAVDLDKFPEPPPRSDKRIVMGFAGSMGRGADMAALAPVLMAALERHPHLWLEVIGPPFNLEGHDRALHFPYLDDYDSYVRFQHSRAWDFALAPLRGTPAQEYKTDVKYREYGAQRIPGIYQRSRPYAHVQEGVTGLTASSPDEWARAIDEFVADPALRSAVALNAWRDISERYGMERIAHQWLRELESLPTAGTGSADIGEVQAAIDALDLSNTAPARRAVLLWHYGWEHLAQHGFRATATRTWRFTWKRLTRRV